MLKIFFLISWIFLFFVKDFRAQFSDNFDSYQAGQRLACQNQVEWSTWSNLPCNATEDALITDAYSLTSPNSVLITSNNDIIKVLGDKTAGSWYLSFNTYIPTGRHGYFSILSDFSSQVYYAMEFVFSLINPGKGRLFANHTESSFSFQYDTWNYIQVVIDLDSDQAEFWFNDSLILTWPWTQGSINSPGKGTLSIDAVDFWGATPNDGMYIDNFWFHSAPLHVELSSFTVRLNSSGHSVLSWVTASEINNRGFEVERKSRNGDFFTVGFVEGYGTTTEEQIYSYIDEDITPGVYSYRLKQIDFDGKFEYSSEVELEVTPPLTYNLEQNYPNPFNPTTSIKFSLADAGNIKLAVYNILGEEIEELFNGQKEAGLHEINFDASSLPSGTYFYRINAGKFIETKKFVLLK